MCALGPIAPVLPILVAVALAAVSSSARADVLHPNRYAHEDQTEPFVPVSERRFGLGMASLYMRWAHVRDPALMSGMSDVVVGGLSARAVYGTRVGYGAGLDLELGAAGAPGFAFGGTLFPGGVAVALGPTGLFGLFFGVGINGISARVPFALRLPAEARVEFDLTRRARLGVMFGIGWTPFEAVRRGGSTLIPFADESMMAISARFGKTFPRRGANMGRGYFLRLERREQMGTTLLGLAFGVEIDMAN